MIKHLGEANKVNAVLEAMDKLERGYIEIGFLADEKSKIITIAVVNEFGARIKVTKKMRSYLHSIGLHLKNTTEYINIPERSFIRASYDENRTKLNNTLAEMISQVVTLRITPDEFFKQVGEHCVGLIYDYMTDLKTPPNHPFTIARKEKTNPLIDTELLRSRIKYKVKYK